MTISHDTVAGIVATVLKSDSATAYAPSNPAFGIIVIPDETWLGDALIEYVRVDGIGTRGHAVTVDLHTSAGIIPADDDGTPAERVAARIRAAINAVIAA